MTIRSFQDENPSAGLERELAQARKRNAELEAQRETSTLELTVQSTTAPLKYRLKAEWNRPGDPVVCERLFTLDEEELLVCSIDPTGYGTVLGKALFADNARDLFKLALGDGSALRVLLAVEAVELQGRRWERLCGPFDDGEWGPLRPNQLTPFSLYIPSTSTRRFPPFQQDELRALVVVASPDKGNKRVSWFNEADALKTVLDGLGDIPSVVLSSVEGSAGRPSLREICRQLSASRFTLLHLVCHGSIAEGNVDTALFLDADETLPLAVGHTRTTAVVPTSLFIKRLSELGKGHGLPHFAFLSVCHSATVLPFEETPDVTAPRDWREALRGLGQRLVKDLGVKSVVAMTDKISQDTALDLGRAFYPALQRHGEADVALAEACIAVRGRSDVTTPALFSRVAGKRLFSASERPRPLTSDEINVVLVRVETLFAKRAPVLLEKALPSVRAELNDPATASDARAELERLCEEVLEVSLTDLARDAKAPSYDAVCPFPGLCAFTSAQQRYFRGRAALVARLVERVTFQSFMCVLGSSGSGKSSLVAAGLIPALVARRPDLKVARMTPGSKPCANLAAALAKLENTRETLLYVDQFEEAFTLCTDVEERGRFLDELVGLARPERRVIMTMRADFLGECAAHEGLRGVVQGQQELVPRMTPNELRGAVEEQAREAGLRFETGLLEQILSELVKEPGAMPLLQHALAELWERRHGRWLRRAEWETEIGGVAGAIEKTAEKVWEQLDAEDRRLLPGILTKLTRVGGADERGGQARDTRQRGAICDLAPKAATEKELKRVRLLVATLAGERARLLVTSVDDKTGEQVAEVAHEALLVHWPRLCRWIDGARDVLRTKQDLHASAQDWIDSGKREVAFLDHRGVRADAVRTMMKDRGLALDEQEICAKKQVAPGEALTVGSVRQYFEACEAEERRIKREVEVQRERELALLRRTRESAIVTGARELLGIGQAGPAAALLLESQDPEPGRHWDELARECLRHGFPRATLRGHNGWVRSAAFSPNGRHIVTASEDGTARVWNSDGSGEPVLLEGHERPVVAAAFSSDGQHVVTASRDGTARVWDADGSGKSVILKGRAQVASASGLDGWDIVTSALHNTARGWDADGSGESVILEKHDSALYSVAFSPDRRQIVSACPDGTARVWDADVGGDPTVLKTHGSGAYFAAFSPDGRHLVTASAYGMARMWNSDGRGEPIVLVGHDEPIIAAACPLGGWRIVTAYSDNTARVWNVDSSRKSVELKGHERGVVAAAFSPDGRCVVTASDDKTARVWNADGSGKSVELKGHVRRVVAAAFSPDGRHVVTASEDKTARVWNADGSGEPVVLKGHTLDVVTAAFSPDGRHIVTASDDNTARVWNADGSGESIVLKGHTSAPVTVAFSPNGRRIVSASWDATAQVWNADGSGKPIVLRHEFMVLAAAFSPNERRIVTVSVDGAARVWNADGSGEPVVLKGHEYGVRAAAFSPDSGHIVTASEDGTARIWNADGSGKPLLLKGHETADRVAAFSRDGRHIATVSYAGTARIWNTDGCGKPLVLEGHERAVRVAAFSRDGRQIVTASPDRAQVWNADGSGKPVDLKWREFAVVAAEFSSDGRQIVAVWEDGAAWVWNGDGSGEPVILNGHYGGLISAAFSPDGRHIVTTSRDNTTQVWTADGSGVPVVLKGHEKRVVEAAFSPVWGHIVTASEDGTARVWDADGSVEPVILKGHKRKIVTAEFSPDGRHIVSASSDRVIRRWSADGSGESAIMNWCENVSVVAFSRGGRHIVTSSVDDAVRVWNADGSEPVVLKGHEHTVVAAAFSLDGRRIVTASYDKAVQVWNVDGSGEPLSLNGHKDRVASAAFSPDGRYIVTASWDHTARVWNADGSGEPVVLKGHESTVRVAAFSPDGRLIVTASDDKTVRVWKADGSGESIVLKGHEGAVDVAAFSLDGRHIVTASDDSTVRVWTAPGAALRERLEAAIDDCLLPEMRRIHLAEAEAEAQEHYEQRQKQRAQASSSRELPSMRRFWLLPAAPPTSSSP